MKEVFYLLFHLLTTLVKLNRRSPGDTRGRFTDGLSIAICWRSAKFSSVNWRRDLNKEQTVLSTANFGLSMLAMLQQRQGKVNKFNRSDFQKARREFYCPELNIPMIRYRISEPKISAYFCPLTIIVCSNCKALPRLNFLLPILLTVAKSILITESALSDAVGW